MNFRVRTLTGKEIELDIEPDYKVCSTLSCVTLSCLVLYSVLLYPRTPRTGPVYKGSSYHIELSTC